MYDSYMVVDRFRSRLLRFGALSVTADELFGIAQFYGPSGLYYFPILGPRGLWDSWVYVFTGLAVCLFLSLVSILKLQRQGPP